MPVHYSPAMPELIGRSGARLLPNPSLDRHRPYGAAERNVLSRGAGLAAHARISGWDGYAPTPLRSLARFAPVRFDPGLVAAVESAARGLGLPVRRMTSGAGHDAQMLARICPTAMIFVPSVGGLSHNPAEFTRPEHLAAGADVLLRTVLALAARA